MLQYEHTLRFVLADGRQILLQASRKSELNEWIARINYASAFKSAGIRMRPLDMSRVDVKLTGIAAAASHLRDLQHHGQSKARGWDSTASEPLVNLSPDNSEMRDQRHHPESPSTLLNALDNVDLGVPVAPEIDGASQFQATFNQVKADLAVGWSPSSVQVTPNSGTPHSEDSRFPSRSEIIQAKIQDLQSRIAAAHAHLDADMRFVRNVATLTPFQKSTRDRLVVALQAVSKRVMQVRLDITKLTCHRDVLSNDLISEGRSWRQAKTIALQAAQETLQDRLSSNPPQPTLAPHSEALGTGGSTMRSSPQYLDTPLSSRPESSLCDSFHSAMDFGPAWISADDLASPEFITPPLLDSPKLGSSLSFAHSDVNIPTSSPHRSSVTVQSAKRSSRTSDSEFGDHERVNSTHENFEEQAEAWNQTRCAQRVSLVRVPSYIQMPIGRNHHD